jgi:lysophospholipase L1-like esterase
LPVTEDIVAAIENDLSAGSRQFFPRLCIAIAIFVLLLGLGELASYLYLRLEQPPAPYSEMPLPPDHMKELQDSAAEHQYIPFVEFRRQPFQGRYISVDGQGVRTTLNSRCDDPKSLRIWMFGDSVLWGSGVSDADTIPSQLARVYVASGQNVCITNYAEQAWVSTQELVELLLQLKYSIRPPDLVVFYDGENDILPPHPDAPKDINLAYYRFRDALEILHEETIPGLGYLERSNTVRALNLVSEEIHRRFANPKMPAQSPLEIEAAAQASVEIYQQNLQAVDALARSYGFRAFYFWYPTSSMGRKPLTAEEQAWVRAEQKHSLQFQLKQAGYELFSTIHHPRFLYLGGALDDQRGRFYLDGAHLTSEGNGIMAGKIFGVLKSARDGALP